MRDRYGSDVLSGGRPRRRPSPPTPEVEARTGLVAECAATGYCGLVIGTEKTSDGWGVRLEARDRSQRVFLLAPGAFLLDGRRVTLTRPAAPAPAGPPKLSASGSLFVPDAAARVARASRIWVEGLHDAELIERVWGHDLRVAGVVVEPMHGADHLADALRAFGPTALSRVGVLLDHLIPGSKESRLAAQVREEFAGDVLICGHPFVDVWQGVKPAAVGIPSWPNVPRQASWKAGAIAALGWRTDEQGAWRKILASVRSYADLEPALLRSVEELIDFVTAPGAT